MVQALIVSMLNNSKIIVRNEREGKTYILGVGDKIEDLKVEEIKAKEAILTYQGEELKLNFSN